jgi:hypothetical protein
VRILEVGQLAVIANFRPVAKAAALGHSPLRPSIRGCHAMRLWASVG